MMMMMMMMECNVLLQQRAGERENERVLLVCLCMSLKPRRLRRPPPRRRPRRLRDPESSRSCHCKYNRVLDQHCASAQSINQSARDSQRHFERHSAYPTAMRECSSNGAMTRCFAASRPPLSTARSASCDTMGAESGKVCIVVSLQSISSSTPDLYRPSGGSTFERCYTASLLRVPPPLRRTLCNAVGSQSTYRGTSIERCIQNSRLSLNVQCLNGLEGLVGRIRHEIHCKNGMSARQHQRQRQRQCDERASYNAVNRCRSWSHFAIADIACVSGARSAPARQASSQPCT